MAFSPVSFKFCEESRSDFSPRTPLLYDVCVPSRPSGITPATQTRYEQETFYSSFIRQKLRLDQSSCIQSNDIQLPVSSNGNTEEYAVNYTEIGPGESEKDDLVSATSDEDEFFLATDFANPLPRSDCTQSVDYLDRWLDYYDYDNDDDGRFQAPRERYVDSLYSDALYLHLTGIYDSTRTFFM